jgi:hypothetical protein
MAEIVTDRECGWQSHAEVGTAMPGNALNSGRGPSTICLAPTALLDLTAWATPQILTTSERALKARLNQERCFNPTHNVRRNQTPCLSRSDCGMQGQ